MMKMTTIGAALAIAIAFAGFGAVPAAHADKHDSNTLHKLGKAIQYPVRKDTENLSVDTHRAANHNSVESMRPQKASAVVTPEGNKYVVSHRGNATYAHHKVRHVRHHRHHHIHAM